MPFQAPTLRAAESADPLPPPGADTATVTRPTFEPIYAGRFFYFDHDKGVNFSDAVVAANFAAGTAWHTARNIPIAEYMLPHYYEFGSNVFQGLSNWGVEFIGAQQPPGQPYRTAWIRNGPFRKYESGNSGTGLPGYYADFLTVPGHPEFDGKFFNYVTQIRDDAGYESYPDLRTSTARSAAARARPSAPWMDGACDAVYARLLRELPLGTLSARQLAGDPAGYHRQFAAVRSHQRDDGLRLPLHPGDHHLEHRWQPSMTR